MQGQKKTLTRAGIEPTTFGLDHRWSTEGATRFQFKPRSDFFSVAYIDDSWLMADNFAQCTKNVIDTISLLDKVGFVIHPEKSVLLSRQIITFLGFVLNSILMQVSLTPERAQKLKDACENLLATASPSIRDVAHVLGLMTSSFSWGDVWSITPKFS